MKKSIVLVVVFLFLVASLFAQEARISVVTQKYALSPGADEAIVGSFILTTVDSGATYSSFSFFLSLGFSLNAQYANIYNFSNLSIVDAGWSEVARVDSINPMRGAIYFSPFDMGENEMAEFRILWTLPGYFRDFEYFGLYVTTDNCGVEAAAGNSFAILPLLPEHTRFTLADITIREGVPVPYNHGWQLAGRPTHGLPLGVDEVFADVNLAGDGQIFYYNGVDYFTTRSVFGDLDLGPSVITPAFWLPVEEYGIAYYTGDLIKVNALNFGEEYASGMNLLAGQWYLLSYIGSWRPLGEIMFTLLSPESDSYIFMYEWHNDSYAYGFFPVDANSYAHPGCGYAIYATRSCSVIFNDATSGGLQKIEPGYVALGDQPQVLGTDLLLIPPTPPAWPGAITGADDVDQTVAPEKFSLSQNYPNPFNPETTIEFQLCVPTSVKLTVFNSIGQQVGVLVDGMMAAGSHQVQWNAASLPSGVYFYSLAAGDWSQTMKMALLK